LTPLSAVCLSLCAIFTLVLVANAVKSVAEGESSTSMVWAETDAVGLFFGLSQCAWCFAIQYNVLPIYRVLKAQTVDSDLCSENSKESKASDMRFVSIATLSMTLCIYIIQGIAIYLVWGENVDSDFVTNLSHSATNYRFLFNSWLSTTLQILVIVGSLLSCPLLAYSSRTNLHSLLMTVQRKLRDGVCSPTQSTVHGEYDAIADEETEEEEIEESGAAFDAAFEDAVAAFEFEIASRQGTLSRLAEGFGLVLSSAFIAIVFTNLGDAIALSGATYCCFIQALPSVVYLKAIHARNINAPMDANDTRKRVIAIGSIVWCVVVSVGGVVSILV